MAAGAPPAWQLLSGGLDYHCTIGATTLTVVPLEAPAPELDAVVVEQDTHGLLAVDNEVATPQAALTQIDAELEQFEPYRGGEVVVKRATPLQLQAIVHDLDHEPSWREEWIGAALERIMAIAAQRDLQRLGMPLLGAVHGHYEQERFIELLVATLRDCTNGPRQIWLGTPRKQCAEAIAQLRHLCGE